MIATMDLNITCDGLYVLQNYPESLPLDELPWQPLLSVGG
jgi:hypothetical protein